jgi:hypothetical protein
MIIGLLKLLLGLLLGTIGAVVLLMLFVGTMLREMRRIEENENE